MDMAEVASIRAAKVDEFGKLAERLKPVKKDLKRYDELRKEIADWFDEEAPDKSFTESGKHYEVEVSERAEERTVNLSKLSKKLGAKRFLEVVRVPMDLLDQYVSPEDQKAMVNKARTGGRRVKARPKDRKEAA